LPFRFSIFAQLLALLLALVCGALALGVWGAMTAAEQAGRGRLEQQIGDVLQTLSNADFPLTGAVLDRLKQLSGFEFVIVDDRGQGIGTFASLAPPIPEVVKEAVGGMGVRRPIGQSILDERRQIGGKWYVASVANSPLRGANAGSTAVVWTDERYVSDLTPATQSFLWKLFAGACISAVLVAVLISRWFARRLRRLEEQAKRIAEGDFQPHPVRRPKDELATLAQVLNETAAKLADATEALKKSERLQLLGQIGGGLAHQLRNSVAGAKLALQLFADDPENEREALSVSLRQLKLAEREVERLLELGREKENVPTAIMPSLIVTEAVELLTPKAKHLGIAVTWDPPTEETEITADAALLGHLVSNLAINAMDAAGPGGKVVVTQLQKESGLEWRFADNGHGPPVELGKTLFEPFVTGKLHGIGLGLAVVRHAALQHGGNVHFEREGGWTTFVVRIPRNKATE
jgi:signal transduction histidine kinase